MNRFSIAIIALLIFASNLCSAETNTSEIDFDRDVRPILSDKCYACHGPDEGQRQANLRLDTQDGAFRDLGGYSVILPGKAAESELIRRITALDVEERMPPSEHQKQLTEHEKQTLFDWIESGANWKSHWAYSPLARTRPGTNADDWNQNFIDAYIVAKLRNLKLQPSPKAEPRTLLRRLHFDLTGLPPAADEVDEFASNPSELAYEAAVDRLLRSPHFGERLAMYWLDLVRYADTVGYHGDQDVSVSPYRDYVIRAFNSNMPFDQFTREQLAGDLLPDPTQDQLIASGYNKLGMMSAEGGVQPEEYLVKYAADRVRTASTVWLGSTLGCAECHNHKFDPFTTKDFYRFAAFFADIQERGLYSGANRDGNWGPFVLVEDVALKDLLKPIDAEREELNKKLHEATPELAAAQSQWEARQIQSLRRWTIVEPRKAQALHGTKLNIDSTGVILARGPNPDQNTYTVSVELPSDGVTALRIEVLPDESLPKNGPGRAENGNLVISEFRVKKLGESGEIDVPLQNASATIEQAAGPENPHGKWSASSAIDHDVQGSSWGWAILPEIGKPQAIVFETEQALKAGTYQFIIEQSHSNPQHTLGKFRFATTHQAPPVAAERTPEIPENVRLALLTEKDARQPEQSQSILQHFRSVAPELESIRRQIADKEEERTSVVQQHTRSTLITVPVEPREIRVLARGNWMDQTGEVVTPGVPHFLAQIEGQGRATRLDLANWLVSENNPLTARVLANRLWKLFFGTGLSKILDDVGSQGESPSHPELLDALALELIESGWDIKHLIKRIVMSNTYRQSSLPREELKTRDPYNRLLARQSRFRLDAETIRDNALATSDLLVRTIGGRSVKPYQPEGLYRHLNFPTRTYQPDSGPSQYRRGLYTHWQRQFLHPAMQAFDAPAREECTAERPRSNTPLAALVLLNDPSYVEAARRFAEKVLESGETETELRLQWIMRRALSRQATAAEVEILRGLLENDLQRFQESPDSARQFVSIGLSEPNAALDPAELAAWTSITRAVLNMHEMVTRN